MQKESIDSMLLASQQQQLYEYALQLRFNGPLITDPYALYAYHQQYDFRFHEQPKPSYSYIGLIAMAILSSPERQLVLSDIYQWISDHYPYFRTRGLGWRNSIRHNLSLNDCFVKAGRSTNGKGHYWSIHPANLPDFINGDFRRSRAQRRVRKSMGLSVTEDEEEEEDEIKDILPTNEIKQNPLAIISSSSKLPQLFSSSSTNSSSLVNYLDHIPQVAIIHHTPSFLHSNQTSRKRCFNVDSLLAPDQPSSNKRRKYSSLHKNENIYSPNFKSDGSTDTNISA